MHGGVRAYKKSVLGRVLSKSSYDIGSVGVCDGRKEVFIITNSKDIGGWEGRK